MHDYSLGNSTWTTTDEIAYLDNLGTHSEPPLDRVMLLHGYLTALQLRPRSRYLDFDVLREHAERLLNSPAAATAASDT